MSTRHRPRTARFVFAGVVGLLAAAPLFAQEQPPGVPRVVVTATYLGLDQRGDLAFKWKDRGNHVRQAGILNWSVPQDVFGTSGLDRDFRSYCAEVLTGVTAGNTYQFEVQDPALPSAYGLENNEANRKVAFRKATYLRELFGRYYIPTLRPENGDAARAFQVAVWEITHEGEVPDVPAPFDLFTGTFQADYPNLAASPPYVQTAQSYLKSLTGDDTPFYENPDLAGRELVRLTGLPVVPALAPIAAVGGFGPLAGIGGLAAGGFPVAAAGAAAQSQFALRYVQGGVGGAGAGAGAALGGLGSAGLGALGGFPGGFGGIGGFPGAFGGFPGALAPGSGTTSPTTAGVTTPGSSTVTTTTPPAITTVPPINTPPVNSPPTTETFPTPQPPETPGGPTPGAVPAPAGLLLGVIGVGLFGGYRAVRRYTARAAPKA